MNLAWISLVALLIAITLSMLTNVNVGVVSLAFAWIVGVYLGGMPLNTVIGTFPIQLFLTLVGVTLLFGMAGINGTLGRMAARAVSACRGNAGVIPIMFFLIALALSSIGPGNIATTAILAPMAMAVGARAGVMDRIGLAGHEMQTYGNNLFAHVVVTFAAYFMFGGLKLFARKQIAGPELAQSDQAGARGSDELVDTEPFEWIHWMTLSVLILLVVVVVLFEMQVGMAALTGAALLSLVGAGNEKEAIRKMPWGVVIMVCGVTVLIGVLEKTQGMSLFADLLAKISTPGTVTLTIAFVTGVVSVYSSTSGVVLPAFLPTVPALAQQLGADPLAIASAMYVGGHLVDLSPLSTIGALCIAALPPEADAKKLFNQLLAWGLSMMVVGALICWVLF